MALTWRSVFTASLALLLGAAISTAQQPKEAKQPAEPKKKEALKKEMKKKDAKGHADVLYVFGYTPGIAYGWNYYWPGPVLPGMWGNAWGGMWPYSWWMGGPWSHGGGTGSGCCFSACCGGGYPVILPPVFGPVRYPAVSPFWTPYVAPYWTVPSPAWPVIVGTDDRPSRKAPEYRAVPASANADKLFADALWLFSDDNFTSARDHLTAAIKQSPRDARLWYFKALSERAMKDETAATISAENGAALEIMGLTDKRSILVSLERVQGADRVFLTDRVSGSKALTLAAAAERVAKLNSSGATTIASTGR